MRRRGHSNSLSSLEYFSAVETDNDGSFLTKPEQVNKADFSIGAAT